LSNLEHLELGRLRITYLIVTLRCPSFFFQIFRSSHHDRVSASAPGACSPTVSTFAAGT
jgi:hypothetical protein